MTLVAWLALGVLAQDSGAIQDQEAPHKHESAVPS
jgi:hypothetical protein